MARNRHRQGRIVGVHRAITLTTTGILFTCSAFALSAAAISTAAAQDEAGSAKEDAPNRSVTPPNFSVIDIRILDAIGDTLSLSDAQRNHARWLHETYWENVRTISGQMARAADDAGAREAREIVDAAHFKGFDPPWDVIRELGKPAHNARLPFLRELDLAFEEFLADFSVILADEQAARMQEIRRLIRRLQFNRVGDRSVETRALLPPERAPLKSRYGPWFEVTLIELAWIASHEADEEAGRPEGELAFLARVQEGDDPDLVAARNSLNDLLQVFELDIDQQYQRHMRSSRRSAEERYNDSVSIVGPIAHRRHETAMGIFYLLQGLDRPDDATRWITRYHARFFPDLYTKRWPEEIVRWIQQSPDATEDQIAAINELNEDYLLRRAPLRAMAVDRWVAARRRHGSAVGTEPDQLRSEQARYRLRLLIDDCARLMRSVMTPEQDAALRADFRAAYSGIGDLRGPYVSSETVAILTGKEPAPVGGSIPPMINPATGRVDEDYGKYTSYEDWKARHDQDN